MSVADSVGDVGSVKPSIASGNELSASAKATLVDVSGSTVNFRGITRPKRESFLAASLRARMQAKK